MQLAEQDLFQTQGVPLAPIAEGTVGWPGSEEITELGKEAGDEMTLVRVTLFVGSAREAPEADDGGANGYQIAARVMGPGWRVPKRGLRVLVVIPGGDWETPGNAVILGEVGASPDRRFGRKKTVLDFGEDDVVIVGRSVSLVSEEEGDGGNAHRHVVSVSRLGGAQVISDGCGFFVKDRECAVKVLDGDGNLLTSTVHTQEEIAISVADNTTPERAAGPGASIILATAPLGANCSVVTGGFIALRYATSINFGAAPSPATPVLVGLSGQTGTPSSSMFGSP